MLTEVEWGAQKRQESRQSTELVEGLITSKNPQRGINVGRKGDHHENKIRNINFESDGNSLSNGK